MKKLVSAEHDDTDPQSEGPVVATKSSLSQELERIRTASVSAARKRETVPQPLFWSLFLGELAEVKRRKSTERFIQEVFNRAREGASQK